jgi:hypothetical protein
MSGTNSSYIFLSLIGGVMVLLFSGGLYYAHSGDSLGAPTGFSPVASSSSSSSSWDSFSNRTASFGGGKRKTHRQRKVSKKTRKH